MVDYNDHHFQGVITAEICSIHALNMQALIHTTTALCIADTSDLQDYCSWGQPVAAILGLGS